MSAYEHLMATKALYDAGQLEATPMEALARVHAGVDKGDARPLTPEEREYMAQDADNCYPGYPYREGIALSDADLCRWWLDAMHDYVQDLFL